MSFPTDPQPDAARRPPSDPDFGQPSAPAPHFTKPETVNPQAAAAQQQPGAAIGAAAGAAVASAVNELGRDGLNSRWRLRGNIGAMALLYTFTGWMYLDIRASNQSAMMFLQGELAAARIDVTAARTEIGQLRESAANAEQRHRETAARAHQEFRGDLQRLADKIDRLKGGAGP